MPGPTGELCGNCYHFYPRPNKEGQVKGGECRRYPTVLTGKEDGRASWGFCFVSMANWCGEYKYRELHNPRDKDPGLF